VLLLLLLLNRCSSVSELGTGCEKCSGSGDVPHGRYESRTRESGMYTWGL